MFKKLLIALLFGSILSVNAQDDIFNTQSLDYKELRGVNAIVRKDELTVDIDKIDKMSIHGYRVVTVLNSRGNNTVDAYVKYSEDYKVRNVEAEIYDEQGNLIKKVKERDFKDSGYTDGFSLYVDDRMKYLEYEPTSYPYTVVFSYELKTENTAFLPTYYFVQDYDVAVDKAVYRINYDKEDFPVRYKLKNTEGISLQINKDQEGITFEALKIKKKEDEELSPAPSSHFPYLLVATDNFNISGYEAKNISNWNNLGSWFCNNLLKDRDKLSEATIAEIKKITADVKDVKEKAKRVYEYVQGNTRYVSVQIGIGGFQPATAEEVDRVKYGDCKGLTNYTKALLSAIGIESYYTHVESGKAKIDFEEDFATFGQGNHVILSIPINEELFWIDCTSKTSPFGFLGDFTDGRKVFLMKPEGGEILSTPSYLDEQNYQNTEASMQFTEKGELLIEGTIVTGGIQYDNRRFVQDLVPEELKKRDYRFWNKIRNLEVEEHLFFNSKDSIKLTEKVVLKGDNFGKRNNDQIIIPVNVLNKINYVPKRYRNRRNPFVISRGYQDKDKYYIQLPSGYKVQSLPLPQVIETEFGVYDFKISLENDEVLVERKILIKQGEYPKEKYEAYREFRKKTASLENAKISVVKI